MSWRTGGKLFADVWPLLQAHIHNKRQRQAITTGLLQLLIEHDIDPADVADVHPEVRAALAAIGVEAHEVQDIPANEAVAGCIHQLGAANGKARATAAEALRHFVLEADDPNQAAAVALPALAAVLGDAIPKVRREAAMSIRVLARAGYHIPSKITASLRTTKWDDEVVASRIREALAVAGR